MKTAIRDALVTLAMMLSLVSFQLTAAELKLPDMQATLNTTEEDSLGTDDGAIGLTQGETVGDFSAKLHTGESVSFADLKKRGRLLVVFYRGGWCPYCNVQIRQLTEAYEEFRDRKVLPVLISVDKPDAAALAQRSYDIPFPVISDPDLSAHETFNVIMEVPDETVAEYKNYGIVLEQWSDRNHHKIAVSSAFLIDEEGVVRWAHASEDYTTRPSTQQLLTVIDDTF